MEEEEGGLRLSKRFSDQGGEVDLKTKSGTAWSHNFLNQKPWHPLSYPNQRRKWIAEQTHAQRQRRAEEVSREFAQEQEFFRQAALVSKKEKEKLETMKAVSFMYVRPPGYNAESAKAAEISDERKQQEDPSLEGTSTSMPLEALSSKDQSRDEKRKKVPKDVFGRALPTEEQFEILKNAPRLETGAPARVKPFAVEVRNVKCLRCGNYGHQSGDRECPLKDAIMPNEESRLKRNDPLTAMLAHTDSGEPLKWELKQKPGMSPPRGGFNPDDPNQQIVAEDIFDEYGGFLSGENIPELLVNFSSSKPDKSSKTKKKHRRHSPPTYKESKHRRGEGTSHDDDDERKRSNKKTHETKKQKNYEPSQSVDAVFDRWGGSFDNDDERRKSKKGGHIRRSPPTYTESESKHRKGEGSSGEDHERTRLTKRKHKTKERKHYESITADDEEFDRRDGSCDNDDERRRSKKGDHIRRSPPTYTESESKHRKGEGSSGEDHERTRSSKRKHKTKERKHYEPIAADDEEFDRRDGSCDGDNESKRSKKGNHKSKKQKHSESISSEEGAELDRYHKRSRHRHSYSSSSDDSDFDRQRSSKHRHRSGHRHHHNRTDS
ncbi:hypothetical protein RHSIM_Rhsim11G0036700 [Rhododendron simsii]|uniref:CBF1-interacting co-repressor CIR N-terminal domain-containing protein n=1 Tax=Rhododendron simsii TaxID=118357 RepID=A0A834G6P3_RHOSS|nr:hypothetical protein RHSIM_Rhsim11G0036700 [Rhododendron simsii]